MKNILGIALVLIIVVALIQGFWASGDIVTAVLMIIVLIIAGYKLANESGVL